MLRFEAPPRHQARPAAHRRPLGVSGDATHSWEMGFNGPFGEQLQASASGAEGRGGLPPLPRKTSLEGIIAGSRSAVPPQSRDPGLQSFTSGFGKGSWKLGLGREDASLDTQTRRYRSGSEPARAPIAACSSAAVPSTVIEGPGVASRHAAPRPSPGGRHQAASPSQFNFSEVGNAICATQARASAAARDTQRSPPRASSFARWQREARRDRGRERSQGQSHSPPPTSLLQFNTSAYSEPEQNEGWYASEAAGAAAAEAPKAKESTGFKGVEGLARALVDKCGSLERAFASFDYNNQKRLTRTQWETGMLVLHLDCEDLCGITLKQLFKMMTTFDGSRTGTGAVTLENWTAFFSQLKGTDAADLLEQDLGRYGGRLLRKANSRHALPEASDLEDDAAAEGEDAAAGVDEQASMAASGGRFGLRSGFAERLRSSLGRRNRRAGSEGVAAALGGPGLGAEGGGSSGSSADPAPQRRAPGDGGGGLARAGGLALARAPVQESHAGSSRGAPGAAQGGYAPARPPPLSAERGQRPGGSPSQAAAALAEDMASALAGEAAPVTSIFSTPRHSRSAEGPAPADGLALHSSRSMASCSSDGSATGRRLRRPGPPSPTSEALQRALAGRGGLEGLNEEDLDAVAEQQQLEEELKELDLSGIEALAYVFVAKCGSLRRAYRYFDTSRKGQFPQVVWDTGMVLMRISTERLTGFKASAIFSMIDNDPRDGLISKAEWTSFFAAVTTGTLNDHLRRAAGGVGSTLGDRAAAKRSLLRGGRQTTSRKTSRSSRPGSNENGQPPRDRALARAKTADVGEHLEEDIFVDDADLAEFELPESEVGKQRSTIRSQGHGEIHGDAGASLPVGKQRSTTAKAPRGGGVVHMSSHMSALGEIAEGEPPNDEAVDDFRTRVRIELGMLGADEFLEYPEGLASWQLQVVQEVAEELGLWSASVWGCFVGNCKEFADTSCESLQQISEGRRLEFSGMLQIQSKVLHLLAAQIGLYAHMDAEDTVTVYKLGDFPHQVRAALTGLSPDDSKTFGENLTECQRHVVHAIARELGFWAHEDAEGAIEVFNLQSFADEVTLDLMMLLPGEHKTFQTELTPMQRKVVQHVAADLDFEALSHEVEGDGEGQIAITVARLQDFRAEVRATLEGLAPGERHVFDAQLTTLQRKVVHTLAAELALESASEGEGDARCVSVSRPQEPPGEAEAEDPHLAARRARRGQRISEEGRGDVETAALGAQAPQGERPRKERGARPEAGEAAPDRQSTESLLSRLFLVYATGFHRGERIFLRFPDLKKFAEDARGLAPSLHKTFCKFEGVLELTFDDTIQLQSDMGIHTTKGLTLPWFQVFVQKSLTRLGMQVVSLLMALLNDRT